MNRTEEYIQNNWKNCIKENMTDDGTLIGLPYPYTVPSVGYFDEIYYWDTYFTNLGLDCSGLNYQSKYNTDDMLYLVMKYGHMPNGNRTYYTGRSQPPFLSEMVKNVYEHYKDKVWLYGAYTALEKEYQFWMTERISPSGLNIYAGDYTAEKITLNDRISYIPQEKSELERAKHLVANCESGWDCNPRWEFEAYNYAPVDLNSLMYMMEKNMQYFSEELDNGRADEWAQKADKRKALMEKHMKNEQGMLMDYNFKKDKTGTVFSVASFYPMYAKLASEECAKATVENLSRLEAECGMYTCEKNDMPGTYQWDYPNGWACLQYIAIIGLDNYGYKDEAVRIAKKYIRLVDKVFEETGGIWEKYNVKDGNIDVRNEYEMPQMMGWSAGVYLAVKEYLKSVKSDVENG